MAIDFGLSTLSRGVLVSREAYVSVAQAAERAGFGFLSVNDHIIVPGSLGSAYPYTPGRCMGRRRARALLRPARYAGLPRRLHVAPAAADLRHGRAAPAGHRHRQDAGHHRRALRRPSHPRRRRRLDEGGVRAARRAVRGARGRDRRVPRGLQGAVDPGAAELQRQARALRRRASSSPSRCRSRIPPSGSAARARPRCAARSSSAMPGIPATTARPSRSTRRRGSAPA